jgi:predicted Zn-dependent protease
LAYSRDAEREADRIGFLILEGSGYDVNGMPAFFQRLQKATSIMDSGVPAYVRTHPLTIDRIADMQDRVRMVNAKTVPSSLEFYLIKEAKRIKTNNITVSHQAIANDLNTSREVVSRLLKKMEQRGLLELHRNSIIWKGE